MSEYFADLPDGTAVTVVAPDGGVDLTQDELDDLAEANAEADRGETAPAEDVLRRLDARHSERASRAG